MKISAYYTDAEIAAFAQTQGCTLEDFKERWIISINGAYFLHGPKGYLPPIKMSDLVIALRRDLARVPAQTASKAGITWDIPWGDSTKPKSMDLILREHGSVARKLISRMDIEHSYYDEVTQTFYERACPARKLQPEYDENIDKWMRLLGGKDSELLLDWVATITDLSRITCALYLHAGANFGKTLFANGLARLWGSMPTEIETTVGSFNSALLNCPLVFADEELPRGTTSGFVRKMVGSLSRALRRKNIPDAELIGALRLIIAANNDTLLEFDDESFSPDDINAVAARILYIKCDPGAADFLRSIGGYAGTHDWVSGDKIAKHALWLKANRQAKTGTRFLVEGAKDMIHRRLVVNGNIRNQAVAWVCKGIITDWNEPNPGIQFGGGNIYVNASFVQQNWEQLTGDSRIPTLQRIGRAFKPLAIGERRRKLQNRRADFYKLDPSIIYNSCNEMQIVAKEDLERLINRPVAADDDGEEGGSGGTPASSNGTNGHANGHTNGHANGHNGTNGHAASVTAISDFTSTLTFPTKEDELSDAPSLVERIFWLK